MWAPVRNVAIIVVLAAAVDFIPGVEPYPAAQLIELFPGGGIVKMVLTIEPMHSDEWTQRAVMGWESELGKLERLLASRHS